jgi:predicted RNase H-like nuclease (RuvC/YqgF family)
MGNQDDAEKHALADCKDTVDELKHENAELKEENQDLREASTVFGDLAERLSEELRKDSGPDEPITTTKIDR